MQFEFDDESGLPSTFNEGLLGPDGQPIHAPSNKMSSEQVVELSAGLRIAMRCKQIEDQAHLKQILQDANPAMRRSLCDLFKPHLNFTPLPYGTMKFKRKKSVKS